LSHDLKLHRKHFFIGRQIAGFLIVTLFPAGWSLRNALADEYDVVNFVAGAGISRDSNIFRNPDFANPQADTITTGHVGLRVDKQYMQQRFQFDITESASRYSNFSELNFDTLDYRAAWLWHLTPRISGTLSAAQSQTLVPFEDTLGNTQRDLRTTQNFEFTGDAIVGSDWHALFSLAKSNQTSEDAFQAVPDYRENRLMGGVRFAPPSGNSVTVAQRFVKGEYLRSVILPASFIDNYDHFETEVEAHWVASGFSTLNGRLAWVARRHDHFPQRDFSGLVGRLQYLWVPSAKLQFDLSASRTLTPWQVVFASYTIDDMLAVTPSWQISAKTVGRVRLERTRTDFRGGTVPLDPPRTDTTDVVLVAIDWSPLRAITLGANLQRQSRSSNLAVFEYDTTIAGLSASLMF
jgi:exopolysaccharide biosynthesis operon protein EpsL